MLVGNPTNTSLIVVHCNSKRAGTRPVLTEGAPNCPYHHCQLEKPGSGQTT